MNARTKLINLSVKIDCKYGLLPQIIVEIDPVNKPAIIPFLVTPFHHNVSSNAGPKDDPRPLHAKLTMLKMVLPLHSEYIATK